MAWGSVNPQVPIVFHSSSVESWFHTDGSECHDASGITNDFFQTHDDPNNMMLCMGHPLYLTGWLNTTVGTSSYETLINSCSTLFGLNNRSASRRPAAMAMGVNST